MTKENSELKQTYVAYHFPFFPSEINSMNLYEDSFQFHNANEFMAGNIIGLTIFKYTMMLHLNDIRTWIKLSNMNMRIWLGTVKIHLTIDV